MIYRNVTVSFEAPFIRFDYLDSHRFLSLPKGWNWQEYAKRRIDSAYASQAAQIALETKFNSIRHG